MTETETTIPPKSAAAILLDAAKQADKEHRREINRAVKNYFEDPKFERVPKDFLAVAKKSMLAKAGFDSKSHLLTVGKKKLRSPDAWIERKFPTLLKQAEAPRGDVELEAAQTACTSLSMQAELVKSMGVQRTGELMALYGGAVGRISKPLPLADKKAKDKDRVADRDNPWGQAWNLTRQGQYIREHGEAKAAELAARVGSKIGATKPSKVLA